MEIVSLYDDDDAFSRKKGGFECVCVSSLKSVSQVIEFPILCFMFSNTLTVPYLCVIQYIIYAIIIIKQR